MTRTEALELITVLEAAYPRQELKKTTVDVYVQFLQDLDHKLAQRVVAQHIRNEKWFPTIAEIRETAAEMVYQLPSTEAALTHIREAVQTNNYQAITANDLIKQAVETVGWSKLLYSEYSQPLYKQIGEAYDNIRRREIKKQMNTPALGLTARALERGE